MNKFEVFLKHVLTVIFKEMPFNKQKAEANLEKIKKSQKEAKEESSNGRNK